MTADPLRALDPALLDVRGRPLDPTERERFAHYLDLLVRWNRTHDLTACRTPAEVVTRLFRDSVLFLRAMPRGDGPLRAADIGAGAGIPGVPLAILDPTLRLTLIEARRKRVSFLRALQREHGFSNLDVAEGRAETLLDMQLSDYAGKFDLVLTRGVPLASLLPAALPYLRPGGQLIAGGPPAPGSLPDNPGYANLHWRQERFGRLGLTRTFLVAEK